MKSFEDEFDDDDESPQDSQTAPVATRRKTSPTSQDLLDDFDEGFPNSPDGDEGFPNSLDSPDEDENLPSTYTSRYDLIPKVDYDFEQFMPVQEVTDDVKTTESDLAMLNNGMAVMDAALKKVATVDSAKKIVETMIKLIECRRKVKKLQYGTGAVLLKEARGYEVLE